MALEGSIAWAIGLLVVAVLVISVIIPTTLTATDNMAVTGTVTGETYNATANVAYALAHSPIISITTNGKTTTDILNDSVLHRGNSTTNTTLNSTYTVKTPLDNGAVSGATYKFTYTAFIGQNAFVEIRAGSTLIANLTSSNNYSNATLPASQLTSPFVITYTYGGVNLSNITNANVTYSYFAANTGYTTNLGAGTITQNTTGTYYTSYGYGTTGTSGAQTILLLVPLLLAVILLYLAIGPAMNL